MKIALICTEKLPVPPVAGGAVQLYISEILPYLKERHNITVFSKIHPGLSPDEVVDNVRYIRVPAANASKYVKNVKDLLDESFELIHIFNRPKWVLDFSEKLPSAKFSLSLHNEMFLPDKIPYEKAVECINRVEFINTVSKFIADGVKQLYPMAEDKLRVVYSGVNIEKYKPNWSPEGICNKELLKKKLGIENKRVILHVSRLSPKKGTHIVLSAMKKVMDCFDDVALVIIGSKWYGKNEEDDYTKQCKALAEQLSGPVVFTGFIPPSEIPPYYNVGDIFVCASQWNEPLARIHYEAMAAGLPIITTDRGGNAEIFEDNVNGIIIKDYKNPDSFADNIIYLLNNPHTALEMGKKAFESALSRFTWKRVADEVLAPIQNFDQRITVNDNKTQSGLAKENIIEEDIMKENNDEKATEEKSTEEIETFFDDTNF
ncbi:spore coat protein SA [Acetivibrio thermocellus AD2]|jgi:spore coat protein SA|uniref:Spore coat protein SA n=1 Tax=Acetivibrio thermocellus AD2 TaxID=1138384 RepID=A0AB36TFN3_ACETH|nr:glycosyltransferase family 4 protein [Acetivibrio thermocellus]ADU74192.1 glycosyl transferase group 1 [Acetivibrio thermocellus DSM 1313]ALX08135.1 glycosyl transferase group 1 [Acetivibrio thermocellus AD2]ANV75882.1 glycosyl transferase group 1 [Acetivibrio thermocellus DSM 2360]EIC05885.1 glycosyl transferase group 1 [Acetivibrio thermocellus YS]PFH02406.1 spore coat protein SA [Acetivibrio thermocellus AD2]